MTIAIIILTVAVLMTWTDRESETDKAIKAVDREYRKAGVFEC